MAAVHCLGSRSDQQRGDTIVTWNLRLPVPESESLGPCYYVFIFDLWASSRLQGNQVGLMVLQACLWRRRSLPPL